MTAIQNPVESSYFKIESTARTKLLSKNTLAPLSKIYLNEVPSKLFKKVVTKDLILRCQYSNTTLQPQRIQ